MCGEHQISSHTISARSVGIAMSHIAINQRFKSAALSMTTNPIDFQCISELHPVAGRLAERACVAKFIGGPGRGSGLTIDLFLNKRPMNIDTHLAATHEGHSLI